jgi:hypothetical protein
MRANLAGVRATRGVAVNISLLAASGGIAAGLLLGAGGTRLWYDRFIVPDAIAETVRLEEQKCLARVTTVAAAAKANERARQLEAGQSATSSFQQSIAQAAATSPETPAW